MKSVPLTAVLRAQTRRGGVKKLRASGRIPSVIYGRQAQPQNLEISSKELQGLIQHAAGEILLVDLSVQDDARPKRLALVKEVQRHPLSGKVLHLDLHEIAENEKVTINVPVETTGEAEGVRTEGGVLEHVLFTIKIRGLVKDLPEQILLDVTNLKVGDAIHLGDIPVPAGVEFLGDKHISVVSVAAPRTEEEEAAEAAEAAAAPGEVEMIKEKKEEGAEGAPAPAGKAAAATGKAAATPGKAAAAPAKGAEKGAAAPAGAEKKAAPGKK